MVAITREQIVEGILKGTAKANARYEKWSNGWWVTDSGVEGLMVASIAEALHRRQEAHESVLMEMSMANVAEWSKAMPRRGRRPATFKDGNRVDLVLLNGFDQPICVIEVKRRWVQKPGLKDLDRVYDLVRRLSHWDNGSLQRGFLAMMIAKSARGKKTAEDRIAEEKTKIETMVRSHFENRETTGLRFFSGRSARMAHRFQEGYGDWATAGFCIEVYASR